MSDECGWCGGRFSQPVLAVSFPPGKLQPAAWPWLLACVAATALAAGCGGHVHRIPPRPHSALTGGQFIERIRGLAPEARELAVRDELMAGNLPDFLRRFVPITVGANRHTARFFVAPDYLSVGSDGDFVRMPMRPETAQVIADAFGCCLPTRRMVDDIHARAAVKLEPVPFDPNVYDITSAEVFLQSHLAVERQRAGRRLGLLISGIKKDVVITPRLEDDPAHVAIYGWHRSDGRPIQPLYARHSASWVDYSHGIRLVSQRMLVDGRETTIAAVLSDAELCRLLSDEGPVPSPRYPLGPMR